MGARKPLKKGEFNYIRRNGRFTKAQKFAYENLYIKYRADLGRLSSLKRPFGLEIGFGMGDQFVEWACSVPDAWHLIGVELYKPGIGAMLSKADKLGLSNLSFIDQPIQIFLSDIVSEGVDEVRIFFPDPWPKKKHAKRRLINTEFVEEISKKIKDLGLENDLINLKGLTPGMLVTLGEQNILKLIDFADLASDELTGSLDEIKGEKLK